MIGKVKGNFTLQKLIGKKGLTFNDNCLTITNI